MVAKDQKLNQMGRFDVDTRRAGIEPSRPAFGGPSCFSPLLRIIFWYVLSKRKTTVFSRSAQHLVGKSNNSFTLCIGLHRDVTEEELFKVCPIIQEGWNTQ